MAVIRIGEIVFLVPAAFVTAAPPVSLSWLAPAIAVFATWMTLFAWVAAIRGLTNWIVLVDVVVTAVLCLANSRLVPLGIIYDGSGWVATATSLCLVGLPLSWGARASVPAGLLVVAAFAVGTVGAGEVRSAQVYTPIILGQLTASAVVMAFVRRAGRSADEILTATTAATHDAAIADARRVDEATQLRELHDTALTTLTLVGTGAIGSSSGSLAARAAADLASVEKIVAIEALALDRPVQLDSLLRGVVVRQRAGLDIILNVESVRVSAKVGLTVAGAVEAAIQNIALHADVQRAWVTLRAFTDRAIVEIEDRGRGFDPAAIPTYRFGIRQSIIGRMAEIDGKAIVTSAPGRGTIWSLEWPQ